MKTVVLGDIHGRMCWMDIIKHEQPDMIVFMGDYVSTHEDISATQQCSNLEDIMSFQEENTDNVVMLIGNHDLQHLGYPWAECSGLNRAVFRWMSSKPVSDRFLKCTQMVYTQEDLVFTHAGISKLWWERQFLGEPTRENLMKLNTIEPCEMYAFTPCRYSDYYGDSVTQPPVWIRPQSLLESHIDGWNQVVGHTRVEKPGNILADDGFAAYRENWGITMSELWCVDCLPYSYMVIDGDKREMKVWNGQKH